MHASPPYEILLPDPGLVLNSPDEEHCVHACFQMLYRAVGGISVPSFIEFDRHFEKIKGKYTYEFNLIAEMTRDFDVKIIWALDMSLLASDPAKEILRHFGTDIGQKYIDNSDLPTLSRHAKRLAATSVEMQVRPATRNDIFHCIEQGYYLTATINQRVLQADPGYVAHTIFIYGVSSRGVRFHNPGPPATRASEIAWDLFERAWCDGGSQAANLLAFRPILGGA